MIRRGFPRANAALTSIALAVYATAAGPGCARGEPPQPTGIDAAVVPLPPPPAAAGSANVGAGSVAAAGIAAVGDAAAPAAAAEDPGSLPQTKDKPEAAGATFEGRVAGFWEAIVKDDPERGMPFFFPLPAYEQVKAITNAGSDWRRRLVGAYKRDIHALHKRLGDSAGDAKLIRMEVPQDRARWVEPNEEYNKLGYYRVYGTRLVYEVDGKERSFEVSSLISWRGEWFVVHLTGFK